MYGLPYHATLNEILKTDRTLHFIFRTGFVKEYTLKGKQFPFKDEFQKRHKFALESIDMIYTVEGGDIFAMISISKVYHVDRTEYIVKRALLDLTECYGWQEER